MMQEPPRAGEAGVCDQAAVSGWGMEEGRGGRAGGIVTEAVGHGS